MNNPFISHDYTELIKELESEINEGLISINEKLDVVRGEADSNGYRAIEDYYSLDAEEFLETAAEKHQYFRDEPKFEQMTAEELLAELKRKNEVINPIEIISSNIQSARLKTGLTQVEISKKIGVGHRTYQRWESGEREPSITTLISIAHATGVSVVDLLEGVEPGGYELWILTEKKSRCLATGSFIDLKGHLLTHYYNHVRNAIIIDPFDPPKWLDIVYSDIKDAKDINELKDALGLTDLSWWKLSIAITSAEKEEYRKY